MDHDGIELSDHQKKYPHDSERKSLTANQLPATDLESGNEDYNIIQKLKKEQKVKDHQIVPISIDPNANTNYNL